MENTMNKTIYLVTGAAGFLGGTICRQLIERGNKVRAFVLPNDPAEKYVPGEAEIVRGDLTDMSSLEKLFTIPAGYESVVMHIASIVTVNPDYNQKVMDVNVGGTKNIIELCKKHTECKKLVYCSSTGAIPELPKGNKIGEVNHFDADKVLGCYRLDKLFTHQIIKGNFPFPPPAQLQDFIYGCVTNDYLAKGIECVLDMHLVGFIFGHGNSPSLNNSAGRQYSLLSPLDCLPAKTGGAVNDGAKRRSFYR